MLVIAQVRACGLKRVEIGMCGAFCVGVSDRPCAMAARMILALTAYSLTFKAKAPEGMVSLFCPFGVRCARTNKGKVNLCESICTWDPEYALPL